MTMQLSPDLPQRLADRLTRPLPGATAHAEFAAELSYGRHELPAPHNARRAAVLVLLYLDQGNWKLPLTERPRTLATHAGQISLPGGEIEVGESVEEAALRELSEELQVPETGIALLGRLSTIYVFASNFVVTPCVATTSSRPPFRPQPSEVANLLEPTLVHLLAPDHRGWHSIERAGICFRAPHIEYHGHRIWGATSMILAELFALVAECYIERKSAR